VKLITSHDEKKFESNLNEFLISLRCGCKIKHIEFDSDHGKLTALIFYSEKPKIKLSTPKKEET